jgi:hypothetical protein
MIFCFEDRDPRFRGSFFAWMVLLSRNFTAMKLKRWQEANFGAKYLKETFAAKLVCLTFAAQIIF